MKSVGIQYLEAVRKLKDAGQHYDRDIHLCFVPGKYNKIFCYDFAAMQI